jgi:hypothetical protein
MFDKINFENISKNIRLASKKQNRELSKINYKKIIVIAINSQYLLRR